MLTETWVVFSRQMRQQLRNPVWLFFGITQPLLFLLLFGPLLEPVLGGSGRSYAILVPGLLLQLTIFSGGFAGFGIIQELREGVVERQRVTPARRLSLLMGRSLADVVTIAVRSLTVDGNRVHVTVERGDTAIAPVLRALDANGFPLQSISVTRPTLDDVFLNLTGRSLREDEVA
jgi:hypothetical protein